MLPDPDKVSAIIRQAAITEILPRFGTLREADKSYKTAGDIVTIADQKAEEFLIRELAKIIPGSIVVGEEGVEENPTLIDQLLKPGPAWIVDPVDGTANFADHNPCFAVLVAYQLSGITEAAWMYDPTQDTMQWAVRGQGAWQQIGLNPATKLLVAKPLAIEKMTASMKPGISKVFNRNVIDAGLKIPNKTVRYRCIGQEYMDLSRRAIHFARYGGRLKPWDYAPGVLIHSEAGGYTALLDTETAYDPTRIADLVMLSTPDRQSWLDLSQYFQD